MTREENKKAKDADKGRTKPKEKKQKAEKKNKGSQKAAGTKDIKAEPGTQGSDKEKHKEAVKQAKKACPTFGRACSIDYTKYVLSHRQLKWLERKLKMLPHKRAKQRSCQRLRNLIRTPLIAIPGTRLGQVDVL